MDRKQLAEKLNEKYNEKVSENCLDCNDIEFTEKENGDKYVLLPESYFRQTKHVIINTVLDFIESELKKG